MLKRTLAALVIVASLSPAWALPQQAWWDQGQAAFYQQDYVRAAELLTQGLAEHPKEMRFYLRRGEAYQYLGQLDKARTDFLQAQALDPDSSYVLAQLAWLDIFTGEYEASIKASQAVLARQPDLVWGLLNLGTAYLLSGRYDQAWATYQRGLGLPAGGLTFQQAIYKDFQILRQRGIGHPDMARFETALGLALPVQTGLEVLLESEPYLALLKDKRIAVITNQTGLDRTGRENFRRLQDAGLKVVRLFAPEHGYTPAATGLEVVTLYGQHLKPTPQMLQDIDALVFDIQDIGARFYTYASTMALAMQAAQENDKLIVVLDRPNPLGGQIVRGPLLEQAFASFVGLYPIPIQHGLTLGELARLYNAEYGIGARLVVVPMRHWQRLQSFDETALPWKRPSPSIPTLVSALHYPGTCLFEGTNLSVGRGTDAPFEQIGAPWLDTAKVLKALERQHFTGVKLQPVKFVPQASDDQKFDGQECRGFRLVITDRLAYDPLVVSLHLLQAIRRAHPQHFKWWEKHFDRLAGSEQLRRQLEANQPLAGIVAGWDDDIEDFRQLRKRYLLYH